MKSDGGGKRQDIGDGLKMTVGSVDQIQDYNNPTNTHRSCLPSCGMLH